MSILFTHPAHFIALGCGSGLAPKAPGTFGTLFALVTFPLLNAAFSGLLLWAFLLLAFVFGLWAIGITGRALGEVDHSSIVWDEIVPFWMLLTALPPGWAWWLAAFVLFRFFDIVKPWPASFFDRRVKNAFGVMMDDVVAACFAWIVLRGIQLW